MLGDYYASSGKSIADTWGCGETAVIVNATVEAGRTTDETTGQPCAPVGDPVQKPDDAKPSDTAELGTPQNTFGSP